MLMSDLKEYCEGDCDPKFGVIMGNTSHLTKSNKDRDKEKDIWQHNIKKF